MYILLNIGVISEEIGLSVNVTSSGDEKQTHGTTQPVAKVGGLSLHAQYNACVDSCKHGC